MHTRRSRTIHLALIALFFLGLTIYQTRPLAWRLVDSTVYAPGDGVLLGYVLSWNVHAMLIGQFGSFDATMFYPQPNTLALSENLFGLSLLLAPLYWLMREPLMMVNLVILLSYWTLALTAWWVLRRWTGSIRLAIIGALYIGFSATRTSSLAHAQLLSYQPLLLGLYFAERWLHQQRWRDAVGFWSMLIVQFFFGVYLFIFHLVVLFAFCPLIFLHAVRGIRWKPFAAQIAAGACASALLMYPFYQNYKQSLLTLGLGSQLEELKRTGAALTDYLNVCGGHVLYWNKQWFNNKYSPFPWEHEIGPVYSLWCWLGIGIFIFAWRYLVRGFRKHLQTRVRWMALLIATLLCVVLSLGPQFHWRGQAVDFPMPFGLFYKYFPGFDAMRVPSRFGLPVSVLLPCLAFIPFAPLLRWGERRWAWRFGLGAFILFAGLIWELHTMPIQLADLPPRAKLPEVVRRLKDQPAGPVVFWPSGFDKHYDYICLHYNTDSWFPMLNGRSGYLPPAQAPILNAFHHDFPSGLMLARLTDMGIRHIVIAGHLEPDQARTQQVRTWLEQQAVSGRVTMWYSDAQDAGFTLSDVP